jgi:hypothetical protein
MQRSECSVPAWSARSEGIGVALWTSFLVACLETMIVFAFLDPISLGFEGLTPSLVALRPLLYGCGFFFSWAFTFLATGLTAYMLESGPHAGAHSADAPHDGSPTAGSAAGPSVKS